MPAILYKWAPMYGLSSLSPASIAVEAYLRFAKVDFVVENCKDASLSPTGQLPALELEDDLIGAPQPGDEFTAAAAILARLKDSGSNLDAHLTPAQAGELTAFRTLVEAKLVPATVYSTWCEPQSFSQHTRPAYGTAFPVPLSYIIPWAQRWSVRKRFADTSAEKVYADAAEAIQAIAARLQAGGRGGFFLGPQPCSLDALLFAHLAFYKAAPMSAPELRHEVESRAVVADYVNRVASQFFATPVPAAPPPDSPEWRDRAQQAAASRPTSSGSRAQQQQQHKPSGRELRRQRTNLLWLGCTAAAVVGYVLFSGQYVQMTYVVDDDLDDGDDE